MTNDSVVCYIGICYDLFTFSYTEIGGMDQSSISYAITKVLPDLVPSVLDIAVETLQSLCVETTEDFKLIQETDLLSVLRPIQARKLVAAWNKNCT